MNEFSVILLLVFSACIHATWHSLIKVSGDRFASYSIINIFSGVFAAIYLAFNPTIYNGSYPWLAGSILLHLIYKVFLIRAYQSSSFSLIFPITRGLAPLFILLFSFVFLDKPVQPIQIILIVTIGLLISALALPNLRSQQIHSTEMIAALGTALITASYSIVDGLGGKLSGAPVSFICWMYVFDALVFPPLCIFKNRSQLIVTFSPLWKKALLAGLLSILSYAIIVFAMSKLSIPIVAAIREINIVFAAVIAFVFLKEKFTFYKWTIIFGITICVFFLAFYR